jgi:hypothetical protein
MDWRWFDARPGHLRKIAEYRRRFMAWPAGQATVHDASSILPAVPVVRVPRGTSG